MIRRVESEAEATAKTRARAIVAEAVQRVASDQTAQTVVSVVHLPADEVKGRIIGREGRNIRTFETITGVNVIIDDTPEAVLLSCFDPVRREVGRITLQMLIDDGRIHPHRIEEAFERAGDEVDALCRRAAEDAMLDVGVTDLHPELVNLVGRLKYRTSYGQNVLGHLVETSHIARIMAAEMGIDPEDRGRGALPARHRQGADPRGAGLPRHRRGRTGPQVRRVRGGGALHRGAPRRGPAVHRGGGADPGRRLLLGRPTWRPPGIAGVVRAAARTDRGHRSARRRASRRSSPCRPAGSSGDGQAGVVDDLEAHVLAREVAKQIEEELTYPGQVRVTVIRESRATEIAR